MSAWSVGANESSECVIGGCVHSVGARPEKGERRPGSPHRTTLRVRLVRGAQDYQLGVLGLPIIVIMIGVPSRLVGLRPAIRKAYLG